MVFQSVYLAVFWLLPWSAPLRAALAWGPDPDRFPPVGPPIAPRWLKPLCVQRWVGQAVAARVAWLRQQGGAAPYRFGEDSLPEWHPFHLERYVWRPLHELEETSLRWLLGMEVERLLRLIDLPPQEIGEGAWVAASLAVYAHVAQVYHELRRRYKTRRAREIVREELRLFETWQGKGD